MNGNLERRLHFCFLVAAAFIDTLAGSISMPMRTYEQVRLTNYVSNECLAGFTLR